MAVTAFLLMMEHPNRAGAIGAALVAGAREVAAVEEIDAMVPEAVARHIEW